MVKNLLIVLVVIAGLLVIVATQDFDSLMDPMANNITHTEFQYYKGGKVAFETPCNRRNEKHGIQIVYDRDGFVTNEILFNHNDWVVNRYYDRENQKVIIMTAGSKQMIEEPFPEEYNHPAR